MGTPTLTHHPRHFRKQSPVARPALPDLESALSKPFTRLLSQEKSIPTLFCELVNKMRKWFSISKASMAVYHDQTGTLKLVSWWDLHCFKEGVLMSLPTKHSLFYRALESKAPLTERVDGSFPGNYVEKRIMATKTTTALIVYPLIFNDVVHGVISLSSAVPFAFEMLEDGYLSTAFAKMASVLADRSPKEFWEPHFAAAGPEGQSIDIPYDPPRTRANILYGNRRNNKINRDSRELEIA